MGSTAVWWLVTCTDPSNTVSSLGPFWVCIFSLCLCGLSPVSPAPSHSPKTPYILNYLSTSVPWTGYLTKVFLTFTLWYLGSRLQPQSNPGFRISNDGWMDGKWFQRAAANRSSFEYDCWIKMCSKEMFTGIFKSVNSEKKTTHQFFYTHESFKWKEVPVTLTKKQSWNRKK